MVDEGEIDEDLVRDMTEVLTSFCAGRYGRRGARNRAEKALRCAEHGLGPMALRVTTEREHLVVLAGCGSTCRPLHGGCSRSREPWPR